MNFRVFLFVLPIFLATTLYPAAISNASQEHHFGGLLPEEIISADALREKQIKKEPLTLFDVRVKKSYDEGHIAGATLPLTADYYAQEELFGQGKVKEMPDKDLSLAQNLEQLPKSTSIVTYCNTDCQASAVLVYKLKKLGFADVRAMEDGFQAWEKKGYPVIKSSSAGAPRAEPCTDGCAGDV